MWHIMHTNQLPSFTMIGLSISKAMPQRPQRKKKTLAKARARARVKDKAEAKVAAAAAFTFIFLAGKSLGRSCI